MEFPQCLTAPNVGNSIFGVPVSQTWSDLCLWEEFLNRVRLGSLIELGTWRGGMASYLAHQALARGFQFLTVDNPPATEAEEVIRFLGSDLKSLNLLGPEAPERMREIISELPKPCLLFCDNGNKPREFASFVPLLGSGDYVAVHDWGTEFYERDLVHPVTMLMKEECEATSSMTRFFQIP